MTLNHDAWAQIFADLKIVSLVNSRGYFDITADEIKRITSREPRLMTKIDFREQLPKVMSDEKLAILAIENGIYRIGRFNPFIDISEQCKVTVERIVFPANIITLDPQSLTVEAAALDAALLAGILKRVFRESVNLTIRGKSRYQPFNVSIGNTIFQINGVQIEVDGGYEGATTVNLVEAKIGSRSNISIRQIVYPQVAWQQVIGTRKSVKSFVFFYQEPIFRFVPLVFSATGCYADHEHEQAFTFEALDHIILTDIPANASAFLPDVKAPFPQADRFDKVLAMLTQVAATGEVTKETLLLEFDIHPRQIDYYFNVLRWIGLCTSHGNTVKLTEEGRKISAMSHAARIRRLAEIIFAEPIFNHVLQFGAGSVPAHLFKRWRIGGNTIDRRLHTVLKWIEFFTNNPNLYGHT